MYIKNDCAWLQGLIMIDLYMINFLLGKRKRKQNWPINNVQSE